MKNLVYSLNREFSYFVLLILYVQNGYSAAIGSKSSILKDISDGVNNFKSLELLYESANSTLFDSLMAYLVPVENNTELQLGNQTSDAKIRSKRQSGGGKFVDAANMGQSKVMGLYTQMLKNSWSDVYVGGAHPLHHEVPKSIVYLFKQKIYAYFFPDKSNDEVMNKVNDHLKFITTVIRRVKRQSENTNRQRENEARRYVEVVNLSLNTIYKYFVVTIMNIVNAAIEQDYKKLVHVDVPKPMLYIKKKVLETSLPESTLEEMRNKTKTKKKP